MNKLFTKIATAFVGMAMAFGVGVAVSAGRKGASPAEATDYNTPTNYSLASAVPSGLTASTSLTRDNSGRGMGKAGATYTLTTSTSFTDVGKIVVNAATNYGTYSAHSVSATVGGSAFGSAQSFTAKASTNYTIEASKASGVVVVSLNNGKEGTTKTNTIWCLSIDVYTVATPVQTYTVSFAVNTAGYGTVSRSSITSVPSGTSISTSNNTVTINGTTVTATPTANTAQYTYAFTGWSNNTGTVTAARTITANFSRTTNTFTVNGSGVTNGTLSPTSNVSYGAEYTGTITPATDYTYPDSLTVQMGGNTLVADDDYLYDNTEGTLVIGSVTGNLVISGACVPEGTAYTVTYNANSGTVSPASESIVENGHPSFPTPTRSGYNFKGWQVNGSGTAYTDPEDYTVTGDVTFVASWAAVYTVTFNANGGSSTPESQSVESGSTFTFPSAGTKTHYSFDGWTSTGDEPYYAAGATSPAVTGSITYTAHWTEDAKYTVTYSAASPASGSYAHNNNYGGTYTLLPFASLSGITYDSDVYQFKNYTVGGVNKNPGDTFTLSAATTVTVNFEEKPLEYQVIFGTAEGTSGITSFSNTAYVIPSGVTLNNIQGNIYSNTSNQAASLRFGKSGTTGSFDATITGNYYIVSVTCNLKYYGSDSTATFAVTPNGGSAISKSLTGSWADYTYDVSSAKATKVTLGTDVNGKRAYLSGFTITYVALPELDSVTTSGQKASFKAGEKFSYGGTLTAHYTGGKDDATATPAYFKFGASGINPTTSGTTINANTTLDHDTHNGKYIYVVYTEDDITKYCSYQITVSYAAVESVVIDTHTAEIGLNKTYDYTLVGVTVNTSYADQGYEWIVHANTVGDDYTFDGSGLKSKDTEGTITLWCRSTADNSKYDELVVTVTGDPTAEFTPASVSGYVGKGTSVAFTYGNMNDTSKISVSSNDASVTVGAINASDGEGSVTITFVSVGSATLSISYDGGSALDTVGVTVSADSVTALTWSAPTIKVYSGATTTVSDASSWNVHYTMASGDYGSLVYGEYTLKLGGSSITLPHTWDASEDGKVLSIEYGGFVSPTTSTVNVTQTLQAVMAPVEGEPTTSTLTFTEKYATGGATSSGGEEWVVESDGTESNFDDTKGIHYGTGSAAVQYIKLTTDDFASGTITKVVVNASTASGVSATAGVTVGGDQFGGDPQSLSSSATNYTFTGSAAADEIVVTITKPSSATKAIYCLSVAVTYVESSGTQNIANIAGHEAAQKAVVAFAKAMNAAFDNTENCTNGVAAAWSTASSAYSSNITNNASLSAEEKAYAKNLIKYASAQYTDDTDTDYSYCLERAMATYEACIQKHGQTGFMSDVRSVSPSSRITPLSLFNEGNSNTVAIIVIISVISITCIGGFFFLRKRKEN